MPTFTPRTAAPSLGLLALILCSGRSVYAQGPLGGMGGGGMGGMGGGMDF